MSNQSEDVAVLLRTPLPEPAPGVIFRTVEDGAILLHTGNELYFGLDAVGAEVWALLPPRCADIESLCLRLREKYPEVELAVLARDVYELLEALAGNALVQPVNGGA